MWPWGHLAVGYLCYVALLRARGETQTAPTVAAVAVGTQFPDLVDKPLAWMVGVLPSGRSFAHSLLVATVLLTIAYWAAGGRRQRSIVGAFGVGYVSHSLADLGPTVIWGLLQGDWQQLTWTTYLLWPALSAPPYPNDDSLVQHLVSVALDPYMLAQIALFGIAVVVWLHSSAPGLATTRRCIRSLRSRMIVERSD